jgi:hypothetical protein
MNTVESMPDKYMYKPRRRETEIVRVSVLERVVPTFAGAAGQRMSYSDFAG